jgi:hypothetical protein
VARSRTAIVGDVGAERKRLKALLKVVIVHSMGLPERGGRRCGQI